MRELVNKYQGGYEEWARTYVDTDLGSKDVGLAQEATQIPIST